MYGIGSDSIRYYEDSGLIAPIRLANGYRMYSINDIWRMNIIRDLRLIGFSVPQIYEYLINLSVDSTIKLLDEELAIIDEKILSLVSLRANVSNRLKNINMATTQTEGVFSIKKYNTRYCHEIKEGYNSDEEMDVLIKRLLNMSKEHLYLIGNNQIGSRINASAICQNQFRKYDAVFIIDDNSDNEIQSGDYLSVFYRGSCNKNSVYIPKLLDYVKTNNLKTCDDILELIWIDIHESSEINEHVTELQVKVKNCC